MILERIVDQNFKTLNLTLLTLTRNKYPTNISCLYHHRFSSQRKSQDRSQMEKYPPIEPYKTFNLPVSSLHTLYVEESGNPQGSPIIFIHGGPGGGTSPSDRRYFDPNHYRIILFDQRGASKSTPTAELKENDTWSLVS